MNRKLYKKLSFIVILMLAFVYSQAQITIFGFVEDNNTGQGIPNKQLNISSQYDTVTQSGINYYSTVYTNSYGFFIDTVYAPTNDIDFIISVLDCNNNLHTDTFNAVNSGSLLTFSICSNMSPCFSSFYTFEDTANYKLIHFINNSNGLGNLNYLWTFGDGGTSTSQNPDHYYMNDGTYNVCLTTSTTNGNCTHTSCNTVTVSSNSICDASFTYNDYGLDVNFVGNSGSSRMSIYSWDFGDNTYGNGKDMSHTYQAPGDYVVCLTTVSIHPQTYDTCVSSFCDTVKVDNLNYGSVYGQVFMDTLPVDSANAMIYRLDEYDNEFYLVDSTNVISVDSVNISYYRFDNLLFGDFIVRVCLNQHSQNYSDYAPSYSGYTYMWNNADTITLDTSIVNSPVNLINLLPNNGPGMINGNVFEGNKKAPGDPVGGVLLYLTNNNGNVFDFTYSDDIDGSYNFADISLGEYKIFADVINKEILPPKVVLDSVNIIQTDINIYLNDDNVTAISSINKEEILGLFPNPTKSIINLTYENEYNKYADIEMYNSVGRLVYSQNTELYSGKNIIKINLEQLTPDLYFVLFKTDNGNIIKRKFIKH